MISDYSKSHFSYLLIIDLNIPTVQRHDTWHFGSESKAIHIKYSGKRYPMMPELMTRQGWSNKKIWNIIFYVILKEPSNDIRL